MFRKSYSHGKKKEKGISAPITAIAFPVSFSFFFSVIIIVTYPELLFVGPKNPPCQNYPFPLYTRQKIFFSFEMSNELSRPTYLVIPYRKVQL